MLDDVAVHVEVLRLCPGDTVVLRVDVRLNAQQRHQLAGLLRNRFPNNPVLVLDAGAELSIVRPK